MMSLQSMLVASSAVLLFSVVLVDVALGVPQRGPFVDNRTNVTHHGRVGICTLEVPTIDLISPHDRQLPIPRGNGSREGFSRIEVCCSGYERKPHNHYECQPICENGCENGNCTAPNVCVCKRWYIKTAEHGCIPTCPVGCLHGVCTIRGTCDCNAGYTLSPDGKFCVPVCTGGCGVGGKCVAPETCSCQQGMRVSPETRQCEFFCEGGCGAGGQCVGPNKCSCKPGYKNQGIGCVPDCPRGCRNGECIAPNTCSCKQGWSLDKETASICTPHCSSPCLNGECTAPEVCTCKSGYVEAPGSNGHKCVAYCPGGCENGVCSAPNFCICNPGYVKERKGSNICVRRLRKRSAIHFELIPERVLEGY